ncbi:MAG: hypothetical protein COA36_07085 [Desulfotalea sp.]|nr:MAG: hypothetical protein COA36_07085 [Desulfotalea sp.]
MLKKNNTQAETVFGRRSRKYRRIKTTDFVCQLANSRSVFNGSIDELSVQGFSMSNVPERFCDESNIYRAIFSESDKYYKITVIPRWSKPGLNGVGLHVGYKILDNDWKWVHFSKDILPLKYKQ